MKLTAREKKFILFGACVAAAALVYYAASRFVVGGDMTQEVELKKKILLKQMEVLSQEDLYKSRLQQYGRHLESYRSRLLPGDNPNVAGAELQKILKDFADQSGVEITQKNILPEKKTQDLLTKVSVKIDTNCNLEQLIRFVSAIESYEKHLRIDDFTISGFRIQRRFEIRPSLTISGYITSSEEKS